MESIFKTKFISYLIIILLQLIKLNSTAQHFPNDGPHTTTSYVNTYIDAPQQAHMSDYKGRDEVKLLPGTIITNSSLVYLDPSIQALVTHSSNPSAGFGTTLPELDKDLDVGTIPGQASVNLMGGASYTIPFDFPKGSGGVVPQISLTYNSGGGMGIAGLGWNLNGLHAISRTSRNLGDDGRVTAVSLTNDDWFVFDGSKLIPETENGLDMMNYHTQVESFSNIISHTSDINKGPDWWEIITKDGTKIEIGKNSDSRILSEFSTGSTNVQRNLMWMVNKVTDRSGNYISFEYENKNNKEVVLKKIVYAGNTNANITADCEINFYYSICSNKESFNISMAEIERTLILRQIESKINGIRYNKYDFEYVKSSLWDFLSSIQITNKDGGKFNKTEFNYEQDFVENANSKLNKKIVLNGTETFTSLTDDGDQIISIDYNGDGLKDLVSVKNGNGVSFGWTLYKNLGEGNYEQVDDYVFPGVLPGYINPSSSVGFMDNKNLKNQIIDFDGNGLEDFYIQISFDIVAGSITTRHTVGYTFTSNGTTMVAAVVFGPEGHNPNTNQINTFLADMNGDTRTDLVICEKGYEPTSIPHFTNIIIVKDIANGQDHMITNNNDYDFSRALAINRGANSAQVIDGIVETVTSGIYTNQNYLQLSLQGTSLSFYGSISYTFDPCIISSVFNYLGDFNGDGITEKLAFANNVWKQLTLFEGVITSTTITPNFLQPSCSNLIYVADVNADGKSDVIQLYNDGGTIKCRISNLVNDEWVTLTVPFTGGNTVDIGSFSYFWYESINFTDVDGDGTTDMIFKASINSTPYWHVHYFKRSITNCFLKTVRDGLGKKSNFIYDLASKGIVFRDYSQNYTYPNNIIGISGKFVKILENDNGLGGFFQQSFHYDNPVINRHGKGFLGYRSTTVTDLDNGLKSITGNLLITNLSIASNVAMLIPWYSYVKTINDDNLTYTGYSFNTQPTIINTYTNTFLSNQSITRSTFIFKSTGSETYNYTTGAISNTTSVTNDDGNVTSTTININNGLQINTTNIEYDDNPNHLFTVPYLPEKVTKTSTRGGGTNTAVTDYAYNNNHELETETNNDPEPNNNANYTNTITYEYNSGGSLKKQIASNAVTSNTKEYFYDLKNKNLIKELNSLGQQSIYTYDPIGNTLLSTKDITNLITSAEYDSWFRSKKTISPNGVVAETKYEWSGANEISGSHSPEITTNLQKIVYKVTSTISGAPTSITYYDVLGRAIFTASESITNMQYSGVIYNNRGKVSMEVGTYQNATDDPEMVTMYTYSNLDRKVESSTTAGSMGLGSTTEETGYTAGTTEVTITKPDGKTEKRYTDASGKLVKVIDNQGLAIEYIYNNITTGNKNEVETKVGGEITTHAIFDEAGNQISLFDKQAGETTYEYDGAGQMLKQTDPVGHVYTFTYKPDGRIETKVGDEGTYTYIYEETSNSGKNKLKELQGPNGSIKYYYNNLQRLFKKEEIYPWETYTTNYEYDMYGHQTKYTYPNGFAVKSIYNSKGYLTKMERADNGNLIWQLNETNFADAITKYEYGNGVQVNNIYNHLGSLTRKEMPGVIDFIEYGINHLNGNIDTRKIKLPSIAPILENFTYLENRLESHTYTNAPVIETRYDNFGKLDKKDDAGSKYNYNGRNRLLDIENPVNNISTIEQNIIFNSFKRPETISEGDYELTYTYGPDQERIKGEWKESGASKKTRYYASNFEVNEIVGGPKHEICYISSPNGLCAMYVTEIPLSGGAGVGNLHYTYTDNLGSILAVTDENGTIEARENFDAWGRRRHAITYAYLPQNTPNIHNGLPGLNSAGNLPPWLYRGYTGHEMLDEFTLINMNARLYDPVVGMMLSCDNYVQDATNTQNYNRYAYCLNNPLKYTDPSGNIFVIDDAILGVIGGTVNLLTNLGNVHSFGQGLGYFGIGFVGGALSQYITPIGSAALVGAGNAALGSYINKGEVDGASVIKGALISASVSAVTMGLGTSFSPIINNSLSGIASPVLRGAVSQGIIGTGVGTVGGGLGAALNGGDVLQGMGYGALWGGGIGFATGAYSGYSYAKTNNLDSWSGKSKELPIEPIEKMAARHAKEMAKILKEYEEQGLMEIKTLKNTQGTQQEVNLIINQDNTTLMIRIETHDYPANPGVMIRHMNVELFDQNVKIINKHYPLD